MCRAKPQVESIDVNGITMYLKLKKNRLLIGASGTKYKNVIMKGDDRYHAYYTADGCKVYVGCYKTAVDAAVASAAAHQVLLTPTSPKKKREPSPPRTQVLSPLLGCNDVEASRLSSPVSMPPSPKVINANGRRLDPSSADRIHKSLLQSWYEDRGKPFVMKEGIPVSSPPMRLSIYPNGI